MYECVEYCMRVSAPVKPRVGTLYSELLNIFRPKVKQPRLSNKLLEPYAKILERLRDRDKSGRHGPRVYLHRGCYRSPRVAILNLCAPAKCNRAKARCRTAGFPQLPPLALAFARHYVD